MGETTRRAQCLCGSVTAETRGAPARVLTCSCVDCRRKSGSAFSVSTYWSPDAVVLSGEVQSWSRPAQDGRSFTYHFCPTCGVSLYWSADFARDMIGITAGNFEDPGFAVPQQAYWTEGRPDWTTALSSIPSQERQ